MSKASRRKPSRLPSSKFKVHIGIDFGTDGVGLGYAFGGFNEVYRHTNWSTQKYSVRTKPKATILLNEKYEPIGFGDDAIKKYIMSPEMGNKWMLFERFKMSLYNRECEDTNDTVEINEKLTATNGKKVSASKVFIAAFKQLQKEAKKYLKRNKITKGVFRTVKDSEIQWILSVPAIWNDVAKHKMRQWAIAAGLVDPHIHDQCELVYEPDCASLAIQNEIHESRIVGNLTDQPDDMKIDDDEYESDATFGKEEKYILVDAGGGTVDIACHEILEVEEGFEVRELLPASGGPWGSCYIDDEYVKLLEDIFSKKWMKEFEQKYPAEHLQMKQNFCSAKENFGSGKNLNRETHNVELGMDLVAFIQDKLEEEECTDDVEELVNKFDKYGEDMIELNDEYLEINVSVWRALFDRFMNPMIKHIKQLLEQQKLKDKCNYLCLVGGFSQSPYFQSRMKSEFGPESRYRLQIIKPHRPILSVVEGAAYFGFTPNYIRSRVLRHTYGEIVAITEDEARQNGLSQEIIDKQKIFDVTERKWLVSDCFDVLARKNEEIRRGDIRTSVGEKTEENQFKMNVNIVWSNKINPKTKDDAEDLGSVVVEFPNKGWKDRKAILEFHFAETLPKVLIYREKDPNNKQVRFILNESKFGNFIRKGEKLGVDGNEKFDEAVMNSLIDNKNDEKFKQAVVDSMMDNVLDTKSEKMQRELYHARK